MANKVKKDLTLYPEDINYIEDYKKRHKLRSTSEALGKLIDDHRKYQNDYDKELTEKIVDSLDKKFQDIFGRIKMSANGADVGTQIILEMLNSLMINLQVEVPYQIRTIKSPLLSTAEEETKKKIAFLKQVKDNGRYKRSGSKKIMKREEGTYE